MLGRLAERQETGGELLGYVEALQLTATELQGFASLQCRFDGALVRSIFALASPLVPLLVVLACSGLEVYSRGMGALGLVELQTASSRWRKLKLLLFNRWKWPSCQELAWL